MGDIAYKASNRIIFDFPDPRINENPSIVKSLGISRMRLPIYKIDLRIWIINSLHWVILSA